MGLFNWIGKHPLETAALGAGAWFGAPALAGMFSAAPAAGATTLGVLDPAQAAAIAAEKGTTVASAFPSSQVGGGLLSTVKDAAGYARPAMEAMGAANAAQGLFSDHTPAPQPLQTRGDGGTLAQIVQADQQGLLAQQDADQKRRQQQMALIQGMGRNYG